MGVQMAIDPISLQQLRNASEDAQAFEHYVNDDVPALIQTRLGGTKPNYVKFLSDLDAQFQQFLLESGYQDIGDYAPGLTITARNQVFSKDGELYRAGPGLALPYTTTGDWATEGSQFVSVGDAALRQELANESGSSLIGFAQESLGAKARTMQDKGRDVFHVKDFGAIGDNSLHPLSERYSTLAAAQADYPFVTSLAESIDGAAFQAAINAASALGVTEVRATNGKYMFNRTLYMRSDVSLDGGRTGRISQPNGTNLEIFISGATPAHGASVIGLEIDGNLSANSPGFNSILVHVNSSNDFDIRRCRLLNATGYAIVCNTGLRMTVDSCTIQASFLHCIAVYGTPGSNAHHRITNNRWIRPGTGGVLLGGANFSIIQGNQGTSPLLGGRGNRLYVNTSGDVVTWQSGNNFANVQVGEILVINNGMEFRVMEKISNTSLRVNEAMPTLSNAIASIGCGDWIGIQSQFCSVDNNNLSGGATFGIGCTVGGHAASTAGNSITNNTLYGQGKHALVASWDSGGGGVYDTKFVGNTVYAAGDGGGTSVIDRIPVYLSGGPDLKCSGVFLDANYLVGASGDLPNSYWMTTDSMPVGSVTLGKNFPMRFANPGIRNDIVDISLSGWGSTATTSNVVSYGDSVRFDITSSGTGQSPGPNITVSRICDAPNQPAMVKASINSSSGTLGHMWGEQATTEGQWRATYFGTPVAGDVFTIMFKA